MGHAPLWDSFELAFESMTPEEQLAALRIRQREAGEMRRQLLAVNAKLAGVALGWIALAGGLGLLLLFAAQRLGGAWSLLFIFVWGAAIYGYPITLNGPIEEWLLDRDSLRAHLQARRDSIAYLRDLLR